MSQSILLFSSGDRFPRYQPVGDIRRAGIMARKITEQEARDYMKQFAAFEGNIVRDGNGSPLLKEWNVFQLERVLYYDFVEDEWRCEDKNFDGKKLGHRHKRITLGLINITRVVDVAAFAICPACGQEMVNSLDSNPSRHCSQCGIKFDREEDKINGRP